MQSEECEDGMPPESTMALISQMPFLYLFVNICMVRHVLSLCA